MAKGKLSQTIDEGEPVAMQGGNIHAYVCVVDAAAALAAHPLADRRKRPGGGGTGLFRRSVDRRAMFCRVWSPARPLNRWGWGVLRDDVPAWRDLEGPGDPGEFHRR